VSIGGLSRARLDRMHNVMAGYVERGEDYLAFGQMMLNQGKLGNERILSRLAVETMTADQLTPEQKAVSGWWVAPSNIEQLTPGQHNWLLFWHSISRYSTTIAGGEETAATRSSPA
jgi:hypothetical protein